MARCRRGRIFKQVNRFIGHWRQNPFYDLRQDDPAHGLNVGHPQNLGTLILAAVDGLDAAAEDFGKVSA